MLEAFDFSEILSELRLSENYISDMQDRTYYNEDFAGYFRRLFEETDKDSYFRRGYSISGCSKSLLFDFHHKQRIADLLRIELCHDRFCPNCAKLKQATRLYRFLPAVLELTDDYDLYHCVLTAPNVPGSYLPSYVWIFFHAFPRLIDFLKCKEKIRGIDLSPLGYVAALRNTEITYGIPEKYFKTERYKKMKPRTDYHLHLHTIIAFRKGLELPKVHINKFSYDYSSGKRILVRKFSALEIFLQKLWRLLVDQITAKVYPFGLDFAMPLSKSSPLYRVFGDESVLRPGKGKKNYAVTLVAIRSMGIDDGYSVIMDPVDNGHFVQAFKYAFKVTSDNHSFMSYEQFVTLENALFKKRLIQGYGKWQKLNCDDDIEEGFDEFFDVFKAYLWQVDRPETVTMSPDEALARMKEGEYTFITRSKLRRVLQTSAAQELIFHKADFPPAPKVGFSFPDLGLAYDRYMREKEKSHLFDDVQKVMDPDSGKNLVLLSEQQLNFLSDIF